MLGKLDKLVYFLDTDIVLKRYWLVGFIFVSILHFEPIYQLSSLFSHTEEVYTTYDQDGMCGSRDNPWRCTVVRFQSLPSRKKLACKLRCEDLTHVLKPNTAYFAEVSWFPFGEERIIDLYLLQ